MDGEIATLSPETLAGILKTIFLFLENQNFTETCGALMKEARSKHIPAIKEALARLVVLRPSLAEIVRVAHVDPKTPCADSQVQADFPLSHTDESCILEGSVYTMPEAHPSSKRVSLLVTDREYCGGKFRVSSAPSLGVKECRCPSPSGNVEDQPLKSDNGICHVACAELCSDKEFIECVILKQVEDHVVIQPSCPFSCAEACSGGQNPQEDSVEPEDPVPLQIIHQHSGEIGEVITPLCSTQCIDDKLNDALVESSQSVDEKIDAGTKRRSSVPSTDKMPGPRRSSAYSARSVEKVPTLERRRSSFQSAEKVRSFRKSSEHVQDPVDSECLHGTSRQSVQRTSGQSSARSLGNEKHTSSEVPLSSYEDEGPKEDHRQDEGDLKPTEERSSTTLQELLESHELAEEHNPGKPQESTVNETRPDESVREEVGRVPSSSSPSQSPPKSDEDKKEQARGSEFFHLDYAKLKKQLRQGEPETNRKILQALRWRLTSAKWETRNSIMMAYNRNDVLGLRARPVEKNRSIAEELLRPDTPNHLQEGTARFLNAMASLTLGREYLCQEHFLAKVLIPLLLQANALNDATRCHLLVTLQKLSLRNRMRKIMISTGVMEYILTFLLAKHNELSQYCREYTTALFMNLSLHKEARDQLKTTPDKVVDLIMEFLESDHDECLPYLNGGMYSAFIEPKIRMKAISRRLGEKIEEVLNDKSEEVRQQMRIIQNILKLGPTETYCTECDCLDQDEEVDHLEIELDAGDDVSDPKGEAVLEQFKKPEHCKVHNLDCLRRPVTPLQKFIFSDACKKCKLVNPCIDEHFEETETKVAPRQESKKDAELEYLLAAKEALTSRQMKISRKKSTAASKSRGRSHLNPAELNSIYFQQRHFGEDPNVLPSRPVLNAQNRAKICSYPCVFYNNYKLCYNSDLPSTPFYNSTSQACQSHQAQNRYKCDCYEEMKALIDQLGQSEEHCCRRSKPNLLSALAKLEEPESSVFDVQPSYNELLHSLRRNLCVTEYCTSETNCTVHCECYNLVFQSRPKVTRTP